MLPVIKKRKSIRTYLQKPVEEVKLTEILKAAMFSPSAHGEKPWEIIVVKDKKTKILLAKTKQWSAFAKDGYLILVLCTKKTYYWIENLAMMAENIYLEATNQGLGTCYIQIRGSKTLEGKNAETYVKEVLNIPAEIQVLGMMPLGYPKEKIEEHQDKEYLPSKIHLDKW